VARRSWLTAVLDAACASSARRNARSAAPRVRKPERPGRERRRVAGSRPASNRYSQQLPRCRTVPLMCAPRQASESSPLRIEDASCRGDLSTTQPGRPRTSSRRQVVPICVRHEKSGSADATARLESDSRERSVRTRLRTSSCGRRTLTRGHRRAAARSSAASVGMVAALASSSTST
jgi:hypothetical protein